MPTTQKSLARLSPSQSRVSDQRERAVDLSSREFAGGNIKIECVGGRCRCRTGALKRTSPQCWGRRGGRGRRGRRPACEYECEYGERGRAGGGTRAGGGCGGFEERVWVLGRCIGDQTRISALYTSNYSDRIPHCAVIPASHHSRFVILPPASSHMHASRGLFVFMYLVSPFTPLSAVICPRCAVRIRVCSSGISTYTNNLLRSLGRKGMVIENRCLCICIISFCSLSCFRVWVRLGMEGLALLLGMGWLFFWDGILFFWLVGKVCVCNNVVACLIGVSLQLFLL
jgi:hypothetical protein